MLAGCGVTPTMSIVRRSGVTIAVLAGVLLALVICPPAEAQRYHVRTFTTDDGLPSSQIWSLAQDGTGYVWIGTENGITRYDGSGFVSFSIESGLPNPLVRTILPLTPGSIWVGTNDGVAVVEQGRILESSTRDRSIRGVVWASAVDSRGRVWFATQDRGLGVFDGQAFFAYTTSEGLPSNYIYALHIASGGDLWIGTRDWGAARIRIGKVGAKPESVELFAAEQGLTDPTVRAFAESRDGTLFVGTRGGGLARFDGERFNEVRPREGSIGLDVYALLVTRFGELAVGTVDEGLSICSLPDLDVCRTITEANGLLDDTVYALLEDHEGSLWIGHATGLSQLITGAFQSYGATEGLPDDVVHAVHVDPNGTVWVATSAGVARKREIGTFEAIDGLPSKATWDVHRDAAGRLWIATREGLCRYDEDRDRCDVFGSAEGLASSYIYDIYEDQRGDLWLASLEGVSRMVLSEDSPRFVNYTKHDGLAGSQVYTISADHAGRIWVGTAGQGISVIDEGGFETLTTRDGLPSDNVNAITVSRDGTVWVGTSGGLGRFDATTRRYDRVDSGVSLRTSINAINEDGSGRLWLGTTRGVLLFDPAAPGSGGRDGAVVERLDRQSGLSGSEVLTSNCIRVAPAGDVWFGFSHGATHFDPERMPADPVPPAVVIARVTSESKRGTRDLSLVSGREREKLKWDENTVRVEIRGLSYRTPGPIYQYRMEGFDADWSEETTEIFKEYTNLPSGDYTFLARARRTDGNWSEAPARFDFEIRPAWWNTWWSRTGFGLIIGFLILAGHKLRTRRIKRRNRELEVLIATRTEELKEYAAKLEQHARSLESANEQIQRADEAKSRFLASMSHELRTPLNSIIGFAEVLSTRLRNGDDPRDVRFAENIFSSGHHLLNLINNLLDLSKIESGKMGVNCEDVSIEDLVEDVCTIASGFASRCQIEIVSHFEQDLPVIRVDPAKVRQILYNLLSNAIKFSRVGDAIEIVVRSHEGDDSPLGEPAVEFTVVDHGIGIHEEDMESVFDEFRQSRDASSAQYQGTGLGLAIVRKLVEIQSGRIELESTPGSGSTFRVFLPRDVSTSIPPG